MDAAERQYIRRFAKKRAVSKERQVLPTAFEPRPNEQGLSFTLRNRSLLTTTQLCQYQEHFRIQPSGDLPGLCFLTHTNLTEDLKPPLPPRYKEDEDDPVYGKLHYLTDLPSLTQQNQMATQATQNGLLRPARIKGQEHPS